MQSRTPEYGKDEIEDGQRRRTGPSTAAPWDCRSAYDYPDRGDIREDLATRNVVAEGLNPWMGAVKIAPSWEPGFACTS
jgi:hypothetical protein